MSSLKNHIILYDEDCPLCRAYTSGFIRVNLLDKNGRLPYTTQVNNFPHVDAARAADEIALIDQNSHEVTYGYDSLVKILKNGCPLFGVFAFKPLRFILRQLYFFVSYNRKQIIPAEESSCTPSYHFAYRAAYLIFSLLVVAFILNRYAPLMEPIVPPSHFARELMICSGQILFQGVLAYFVCKGKVMDYLGNMMTVSLGGSIVLALLSMLSTALHSPVFFTAAFLTTALFMFLEHRRRMQLLRMPAVMSLGWVFYRILLLPLILS